MSVVLLASGGVDSCVLAALYAERGLDVWPLFIDYGQLAAKREWAACRAVMATLGVNEPTRMDLSGFGAVIRSGLTDSQLDVNKDAFLPSRNLMLLIAASAFAFQRGGTEIVMGLVDEGARLFPDQSSSFLQKAEEAVAEALGLDVRITAPLLGLSKSDVLALRAGFGLEGTYSCHRGGDRPCGDCVSCRELITASRR